MWDEPTLAAEVIARDEDATGTVIDLDLVFADGVIQAYTDLAELLAEQDDDVQVPGWRMAARPVPEDRRANSPAARVPNFSRP